MQVNLQRVSNVNPAVCSHTVINGVHHFNRHPLAPLGIEMHMLEHPDKRESLGVKGKKGNLQWNIPGTLPILLRMVSRHKTNKRFRNSQVQAHIYHKPWHNTSRCHRTSHKTTYRCALRQHTAAVGAAWNQHSQTNNKDIWRSGR